MDHNIPVTQSPQPAFNVTLRVIYVCPTFQPGGGYMSFDRLGAGGNVNKHPLQAPSHWGGGDIMIPVDPLTVLKLGLATAEDLGLPEAAEAWLKLTGLLTRTT